MLAVDPSTGAMFTLKPDPRLSAALASLKVSQNHGARTLTVMLIEDRPAGGISGSIGSFGRQLAH
jgi:hypothetical protein